MFVNLTLVVLHGTLSMGSSIKWWKKSIYTFLSLNIKLTCSFCPSLLEHIFNYGLKSCMNEQHTWGAGWWIVRQDHGEQARIKYGLWNSVSVLFGFILMEVLVERDSDLHPIITSCSVFCTVHVWKGLYILLRKGFCLPIH